MSIGALSLSGNVCQLQHPPPPIVVPVKDSVTPSAAQNKPLPGEDVEAANAVAIFQATPVRAGKGTESDKKYYILKEKGNGSFSLEDNLTDSFLTPTPIKTDKPKTKYFRV